MHLDHPFIKITFYQYSKIFIDGRDWKPHVTNYSFTTTYEIEPIPIRYGQQQDLKLHNPKVTILQTIAPNRMPLRPNNLKQITRSKPMVSIITYSPLSLRLNLNEV